MRAGIQSLFLLSAVLPAWAACLSGCSKEVKADFPRPPATVSATPGVEDRGSEGSVPEDAPTATPVAAQPAEEIPESEPLAEPARPRQVRKAADPEPGRQEPEAVAPSTQLVGPEATAPNLASKLRRATTLLDSVGSRMLSSPQKEQLTAARGFVVQARQAINDGDERRALVLIDKGLILAEDVERTSRP